MRKTNTERQREYRAARATCNNGEGERRLQAWISTKADLALDRLAQRYSLTRRQVLEKLILSTDDLESSSIGDAEFDKCLNVIL